MKVESITIKNFKAISHEEVVLSGNNVYLIGKNGAGKSSFIDAVFKIITGKDLPSKVVKEGESRGEIEINLGELIVKAVFNSKDEKVKLSVETPEGAKFSSPRSMLDDKLGVIDFDVNHFFNLTPKKQVDFIKELIGIDFTDIDAEYKRLFEERAYVNRRVKDLEAQVIPFDKNKITETPIKDLQDKIEIATASNNKITDVERRQAERVIEIEALEKKLAELKNLSFNASKWLSETKIVDTADLRTAFNLAIEENKKVADNIKGKKLSSELQEATNLQGDLNLKLQEIENLKRRLISEAQMPVDGLTFDDNQLYLNGLPFEKSQINTAQQIITGLQINLALLKDVKIARFDGSLLDNDNIKIVEKWAKENDLQLFVEFVDRKAEGLKIEIQE